MGRSGGRRGQGRPGGAGEGAGKAARCPRCRRCLRRGPLCLRRSSASIYISGARCPMARAEPIRWQIRCQLGGSCRETVAASLPPQFKFPTWRAEETRTLLRGSRPAAGVPPAPRRPGKGALRRARRPALIAPAYRSDPSIHPSIAGATGAGARECGRERGRRPAPVPALLPSRQGLFPLFFSFFFPFFFF